MNLLFIHKITLSLGYLCLSGYWDISIIYQWSCRAVDDSNREQEKRN